MKKSIFKSIYSVVLIISTLMSLLFTTSCNRSYDENEVIEATKKLIADAQKLNYIYYGEGIDYYENDEQTGYYRKANTLHLEELGFSTIDELKTMTEKTFSNDYSELLYSTVLSSIMDDYTVVSAARYYQVYDEKTNEPTHIMVNSAYEPLMKDTVVYNYDTLTVTESKKEKVYAKIEATVTNSEGQSQKTEIVITLVEEEAGWRIDNPIYANYSYRK